MPSANGGPAGLKRPYFEDIDTYDDALKVVARAFKEIEKTKQPLFECFNNDKEINKELNKGSTS